MKISIFLKIISVLIIFPILLNNIIYVEATSNSIQVKYEYNAETNQVIAKIISNTELKETKPSWKLSKDKKTYTKIFFSNMKYTTPVENIKGEIINVEINIAQIKPATIK